MEDLDSVLKYDSLAEVEDLVGKHHSEFNKSEQALQFHFDGREGLRHNLSKLDNYSLLSKSFEDNFLWFNNLDETDKEGFDYKEVSMSYIEKSSDECKKVFYGSN